MKLHLMLSFQFWSLEDVVYSFISIIAALLGADVEVFIRVSSVGEIELFNRILRNSIIPYLKLYSSVQVVRIWRIKLPILWNKTRNHLSVCKQMVDIK